MKAIKQEPLLEQPYNRLMIFYRKNKQYKDESRVVDKAIDIFTAHYDKKKEPFKGSNAVGRLSSVCKKTHLFKKSLLIFYNRSTR
jgi:hypothetical protein